MHRNWVKGTGLVGRSQNSLCYVRNTNRDERVECWNISHWLRARFSLQGVEIKLFSDFCDFAEKERRKLI